jgi:hypothetical protein
MAVLVPMALYESWQKRWDQLFTLIEQARERNKEVAPDVLEQEIDAAIRAVREEKRVLQNKPA